MKSFLRVGAVVAVVFAGAVSVATQGGGSIGREVSVPSHLEDGDEFASPLWWLVAYGEQLFTAVWTNQEGGGRPLTKGTGAPLTVPSDPLVFPRNFNRVSAPDANSCAGCHNAPLGIPGGGGDIVANVFVLGQRFDFATFDLSGGAGPTVGGFDEIGSPVSLQNIANSRATLGMFGSGYIELLAREITADLQALRDTTLPGGSTALWSKGISYGTIKRLSGDWVTTGVEGIPAPSLATTGPADPPSLIIRPFHQAGAVVSIRQFTNNAFNHHHGIQSTERFGDFADPDDDGFVNEITRADITAVTIFQATMPVPGRVIPNDPDVESAVLVGESRFTDVGCASCHIPSLPLRSQVFTEPNPYNPAGNLRVGDAPTLSVDLTSRALPTPRLSSRGGPVLVPAFTDLKLHDITSGPGDPNREALDMNQPAGSPGFFAGNGKFLTRKLWGVANEPPFFHHGQYTTMREAILAHSGEALGSREAFETLGAYEQDSIVEFLKTLQVLPAGTKALVVDENGRPKAWPPRRGRDRGRSDKGQSDKGKRSRGRR